MSLLLNPILQFRGASLGQFMVSAIVVVPLGHKPRSLNPVATPAKYVKITGPKPLAKIPLLNPSSEIYRIDFQVIQGVSSEKIEYEIAGVKNEFYVPGIGENFRIAYGSCFGFSDPSYMEKVDNNNERWQHLNSQHKAEPFNLFLMGGDQVYSDEMRYKVTAMRSWFSKSWTERADATWTEAMEHQVDAFYSWLYVNRWNQTDILRVLGSIPTVMMWDDHDIIDGWGSYSEDLHNCEVFQGLFRLATSYFRLFQQQLAPGEVHPCAIPDSNGFHMGFKDLGKLALLVPDLRSERRPAITKPEPTFFPTQIIGADSWRGIINWLDGVTGHKHLILMSSIPVAYIDLHRAEQALDFMPGRQELEDDLRDHWRSEPHLQERRRLIRGLLDFSENKRTKVTMVSGDVHVAGACIVESKLPQHGPEGGANIMLQLISTGMVHPSPESYKVWFLEQLGSSQEAIDLKITGTMIPIGPRGRFLIPARNWLALEPDPPSDERYRLWAKWHVEGEKHPVEQMIDPVLLPRV